MRNFLLSAFLFLMACGQEPVPTNVTASEVAAEPVYDTVAIDSFSPGATSIDVAAEIRRSSRRFQDSVQQVKVLAAEAEAIKKAKEAEAKKEAEKKKNEKASAAARTTIKEPPPDEPAQDAE